MISLYLAMRAIGGLLLLPPFFFVGWIGLRMKVRHLQLHVNEMPETARQLFGYRMGSYLTLLMFLVSLLAWIGLILAVRFNWNRSDVSEVEIRVFPSTHSQIDPERVVSIKDPQTVSRLFDTLELLQPYDSGGHGSPVGRTYVMRLRRQSDSQWSSYRVEVYSDREAMGKLHMTGVYETRIDIGPGKLNLGDYQAPELGRLVEQLAQEKSAELPQ